MNKNRICSAALVAALALTLTACQSGESSSSSTQEPVAGVAVQVTELKLEDISVENKVSGKVITDGSTNVFVAAQALCTAVYVEAGDLVTAGQAICTLDMASTLSSYNAASISYNSAVKSYQDQQAIFDQQIALAEKNVNDLKALFEIGAASQVEIDQAELSLKSAQATRDSTLAQLEAGMQSYKSNVQQLSTVLENVDSRGNVVAPVSGTVTSLSAVADSYVTPSMPVAVIDGAEQMKVAVSVSEALVPKLAQGDEAEVNVSSLGVTFTGTIRSIEKTANMQTQLYTVTVTVPEDVEGLMSGMFADVSFRTDTSADALVIPSQSILNNNGVQYVFVAQADNTARYVEIQTGLTGNGVTQVTSGLQSGDRLVTVGQAYLSDGDPIRIVSGEG